MKDIDIKINQALESIEKIEQASVPNFFEARLRAKMEQRFIADKTSWIQIKKPVWIVASLVALLLINIYLLGSETKTSIAKKHSEEPANIESFANDYQLNSNASQY